MEKISKDTENSAGGNNITNMKEVTSSPNYILQNTGEILSESASINVDEWLKPRNELVANIDVDGVIKTEGMESSYLDALGYHFLSPKDSVDMCIVANICDMGLSLDGNVCDKNKLNSLLTLNDKESTIQGSSDSEERQSFLEDLDPGDISDKEILVAVDSSEVGDSDQFNLIRYCNSVSVNYILEPNNEESLLPNDNSISSELREDGSYCEDETVCKKPLASLAESKEKISCESYIISRQSGTLDAEKDVDFPEFNFLSFQVDPNDGMNALSQVGYCENELSDSCNIPEASLLRESDSISECALVPETCNVGEVPPIVSGSCNMSDITDTTFSHKWYSMPATSVISDQYNSSETSVEQEECTSESSVKQTPCMSSASSFVAEECNLSQTLVTDECNLSQTLVTDECSSSETPLITEQCHSPTPLIVHCSLPEESAMRQSSSLEIPLLSGPSVSETSQLSNSSSSEETQLLPVHCSSSEDVCVQEQSGISDIVCVSEQSDSSEVLSVPEQCSASDVSVLPEECNSLNVSLTSSHCSSSDVPLSLKSIVSESPIITSESCGTSEGTILTEHSSSTEVFRIPPGSRVFIAENSNLLHAYNVVIDEKDLINANISSSVPKQKIAHSKYSLHSSPTDGLQNLMVSENKLSGDSNNQCSTMQYVSKLKPAFHVRPTNPRSVLKTPLHNIIQTKNVISSKPTASNSSLKRTLDTVSALTNVKSGQENFKSSKKKPSPPSMAVIAISTNKTKNTTEIVINTSLGEQKFKGKTSDIMKASSSLWNKFDNNLLKAKADIGQSLNIDSTEEISSSSSCSSSFEGVPQVQQFWMKSGKIKNSADVTVFPVSKYNDHSSMVVHTKAAANLVEPLFSADTAKRKGPSTPLEAVGPTTSVETVGPTVPVEIIGLTACAKTNQLIAPAETNRPIAPVETNVPTPVQTDNAVKKFCSKRGPNFWPVEQPITEALLELGIDVYSLKYVVDSRGQKLHACPYKECNKVFSRMSMLKVHILTHYGVRPYKCDYDGCHWTFYTYFKLKRHRETHLKRKLFICPINNCGRRFTTIYNLNSHQKLHERPAEMICPVETCRACFQTKRSMELHMKLHDSEHAPYRCSFEGCGKHYYSANSLNCHIRSHQHKEEEVRCQWEGCGKLFDKPCRLKAHMRTHTGDKPYPCMYQDCGWAFSSASKLKRHQHKHTNERRFRCSYDGCNKSFMRSEHLKEHALTHVGARTFHCTVENCGVKFSAKSSLYVHLKKHNNGQHQMTEDRSNHCPIQQCKRKCGSKAALRQHMMLVHTHIEASGSNLIDYSPLMTGDEDLVMLDDLPLSSDIVPVTSDLLGTESIAAVLPAPDPQSPSYLLHQSDSETSSSVPLLEMQLQEDSEDDVTSGSARTSYTYQDIVQYRGRKNDETTHPIDSPGLRLPTDVVLGTGILGNTPDITNTLLLQDDQSTYPDDSIVSSVGEFQVLLLDPGGNAQREFAESTINLRDLE